MRQPVRTALQVTAFRLRVRYRIVVQWARRTYWSVLGMQLGRGASLGAVECVWPHQVKIGEGSAVLDGTVFDYCYGNWRPGPCITIGANSYVGRRVDFNCRVSISVGDDCLIAAGCRFIDHDHATAEGVLIRAHDGPEIAIKVGNNVWLGANAIVLKGVNIGDGAIVGAGAVVTQSIPANEIWAGVPARRLGTRANRSSQR